MKNKCLASSHPPFHGARMQVGRVLYRSVESGSARRGASDELPFVLRGWRDGSAQKTRPISWLLDYRFLKWALFFWWHENYSVKKYSPEPIQWWDEADTWRLGDEVTSHAQAILLRKSNYLTLIRTKWFNLIRLRAKKISQSSSAAMLAATLETWQLIGSIPRWQSTQSIFQQSIPD